MNRRHFMRAGAAAMAAAPAVAAAQGGAGSPAAGPKLGTKPVLAPGEHLDARSRLPATASDALSTHAVKTRFADLDAATLAKAKHRVLDLIGCAIGGAPAEGNRALVQTIADAGGRADATVIGYPVKGPVAQVAMANAVLSRSFDFEVMTVVVGDQQVASHHSPTTCMTALAYAEKERASGKDFIAALVVGDDIAARLLYASGLDFFQGWDGAPVYSALAATAIAARFLDMTPLQTRDAFGIAVDQIAGTVQNIWDGATNWKLQQGLVSRNAVLSAELAKGGWVGLADPLLAPYGFFAQYTAGCERPAILTSDLGRKFYAEEYFKPYPACAATHPTIEAALALVGQTRIDPNSVERIVIGVPERSLSVFVSKPFEARRSPHCDANFSHQFMVANVLLHGSVRQEHYAREAITSPAITNLVARSSLKGINLPGITATVEVTLKDGRVLKDQHAGAASRNPRVKGSSYADHVAKFRQQVGFANYIKPDVADEIIRRIDRLEEETDMADFVRLVTRTHLA